MSRAPNFHFSGLNPAQHRFVRVLGLVEAAEIELYAAEHELPESERAFLREERLRLGQVATFAENQVSPEDAQFSVSSARIYGIKLCAALTAVDGHALPLLACIEPPGPDCQPELAAYLRRLLNGTQRARATIDAAPWGAP